MAFWLLFFALVQCRRSFSADPQRQENIAYSAAFADGLGWGSLSIFLMGIEPVLDAQLAAVLCGVVAVTLGIYITAVRAFALQFAGTWTSLLLALVVGAGPGWLILLGLAAMYLLTLYLLPPIVFRIVDGICLQRTNAELVDLDHFKQVDDEHGHAVGDRVRQAFVEQSRSVLRQGDLLARLGGEELVVVLPRATITKRRRYRIRGQTPRAKPSQGDASGSVGGMIS